MSLVPAALLALFVATAAPAATLATSAQGASRSSACEWNQPGHNPFMGDVVAAVDRYNDIPAAVRSTLKARMAARSYDEVVEIRRDAIVGQARYGAEIRDMHFGTGQVCGTVNRTRWAANAQERGLVYCEAGHCILVPTVCRNVSRISRVAPAAAAGAGGGSGGGAGAVGSNDAAAPALAAANTAAPSSGPAEAAGAAPAAAGNSFAEAAAPESAGAGLWGEPGLSGGGAAGSSASASAAGWAGGPGWIQQASAAGAAGWATAALVRGPERQQMALSLGQPGSPGGEGLGISPTTPVPEPGSWALMLGGLLGLVWRARHRRQPSQARPPA